MPTPNTRIPPHVAREPATEVSTRHSGEAASHLADLRQQINAGLDRFTADAVTRLIELDASLGAVGDQLRGFLTGGKRLRPLLLLLGHESAGGRAKNALGPALALELLHTCALIHDDVIDAAPTRRGRPTIHAAFATEHDARGWDGDRDAFGAAAAILIGDLAFVHADELFMSADLDHAALMEGFRTFSTLREEVMAGQYLDVLAAQEGMDRKPSEVEPSAILERALAVASLKSGRYSVARPLEVGAQLAGNAALGQALYEAGLSAGRAFQLRDDILGVFGDPEETGKSSLSDLREGKRTVLVAETMARLAPDRRSAIAHLIGKRDLSEAEATVIRDAMRECGALAAVEDRISADIGVTTAALDELAADLAATPARAMQRLFSQLARR